MKRLRAIFSGNVQGVGFRYTAHDLASRYAINGWVKNRSDGRVEVVAEGREETLKAYLTDLQQAMAETIRESLVDWSPATEEFSRFEIRY